MQLDIGMVFSSLIGLFLLMGVGWVSVKTKIVPPAASAPMSSLLLKVTLPCTIFSSLATREFDSAFLVDGVIIIVIGLVLFPLYAALSWGISKVLKSTGWPFTSICPPFSSILRKPTLIGSTSTVLLPFFRVAVSV